MSTRLMNVYDKYNKVLIDIYCKYKSIFLNFTYNLTNFFYIIL